MKDHCILNKSENPKFETGAGVGMENSKFEIRNIIGTSIPILSLFGF
jgi:hypothetical protein